MRAIANGEARHGNKTLEILNYTTFGSLIHRKYVTIDSRNNPTFTEEGYKAFETYQELHMPVRNHPGEVTEFVATSRGLLGQGHKRAVETVTPARATYGRKSRFTSLPITYENGASQNL